MVTAVAITRLAEGDRQGNWELRYVKNGKGHSWEFMLWDELVRHMEGTGLTND